MYATDADFALATDDGTVALDTTRGQVALEGFGDVASANAGSRRVTAANGGRAVKSAIPTSRPLEVAWPEARETRSATVNVHGRTDPYAKVTVGRGGAWQEVWLTPRNVHGRRGARGGGQSGRGPRALGHGPGGARLGRDHAQDHGPIRGGHPRLPRPMTRSFAGREGVKEGRIRTC